MAIKLTIHEYCQRCGEKQATLKDNIVYLDHDCPNAPPGPKDGPRTWFKSEVLFKPKTPKKEEK